MKRILVAAFALVLVLSMSVFSVSAADSYDLIPLDGEWTTTPYEGYDITVNVTEEAAVFSAEGYWPAADCYYADDDVITVSIDDYSLVYDFSVEVGMTNINFTFTDGFGSNATFTICNNTLGTVSYDSGSGDLHAGEYKGVIRLSDFVNSTKFLNGEAFPSGIIGADNTLTFTAIQVYSVSSATVTIRELALVPNEEAGAPTGGATGTESSEAPVESSEDESEEESEEESKTESKEDSEAVSVAESTATSDTESTADNTDNDGLSTTAIIAIVVAAVVVIAVIVFIVVKKKK